MVIGMSQSYYLLKQTSTWSFQWLHSRAENVNRRLANTQSEYYFDPMSRKKFGLKSTNLETKLGPPRAGMAKSHQIKIN